MSGWMVPGQSRGVGSTGPSDRTWVQLCAGWMGVRCGAAGERGQRARVSCDQERRQAGGGRGTIERRVAMGEDGRGARGVELAWEGQPGGRCYRYGGGGAGQQEARLGRGQRATEQRTAPHHRPTSCTVRMHHRWPACARHPISQCIRHAVPLRLWPCAVAKDGAGCARDTYRRCARVVRRRRGRHSALNGRTHVERAGW